MIIICEECGQKYRIDPDKISGSEARFRCKNCNYLMTVKKQNFPKPSTPRETPAAEITGPVSATESRPSASEKATRSRFEATGIPSAREGRSRGLGLRSRIAILFLVIPMGLMIGTGLLYFRQLKSLSSLITKQSSNVVTHLAEQLIAETARSVSRQVRLYLDTHPDANKRDFNSDPSFKAVAVQKVGSTGYTALYELPGESGIWRTWAHVNPKIIGIDMTALKKPLGDNFPGFWSVYTGVDEETESKGYYRWQDADGRTRDKFMVCTPVDGTRFVVAATTYLDEFTLPVDLVATRAEQITRKTRNIIFAILGGALLIMGAIVSVYGYRLTGKIKSLTDLAERISVGDLDAEIAVDSGDEIGALAESISRMQESIRLSIERLRRRGAA